MTEFRRGTWTAYHRMDENRFLDCGVFAEPHPGMAYSVCRAPVTGKVAQWMADGALIAAAPKLLRALQALVAEAGEGRPISPWTQKDALSALAAGLDMGPTRFRRGTWQLIGPRNPGDVAGSGVRALLDSGESHEVCSAPRHADPEQWAADAALITEAPALFRETARLLGTLNPATFGLEGDTRAAREILEKACPADALAL